MGINNGEWWTGRYFKNGKKIYRKTITNDTPVVLDGGGVLVDNIFNNNVEYLITSGQSIYVTADNRISCNIMIFEYTKI